MRSLGEENETFWGKKDDVRQHSGHTAIKLGWSLSSDRKATKRNKKEKVQTVEGENGTAEKSMETYNRA